MTEGDLVVIPGGTEHEAWFREDTEVIDFFAPPRDDFLLGGKPSYMNEGWNRSLHSPPLRRLLLPLRPRSAGAHTPTTIS